MNGPRTAPGSTYRFTDAVAVITGATRGIGYGFAEALLDEGARVFICGRERATLESALEELDDGYLKRVAGVIADVGNYEDCRNLIGKAIESFGKIDILINNAGIGHTYKPIDEITPETWDKTLHTNLFGSFYCSREAVPHMRKAGGGYIFNISSVAAILRLAGGSAYNASKCGLSGFTDTLMKDVRYDGIRVTELVIGSVSVPTRERAEWKMEINDVVQVMIDLCRLPSRAMVGRVELWPTMSPPNR
jgi:3-oxoacyl-[acyl-carrier protein] reductase